MIKFNEHDILSFDQRYRATFINSLGGFKSLALIGTKNKLGQTNLAVFNSIFHLGANPPLFGFIIRPDSVERHTLENICETNYFTVNHVKEDFYIKAHQTSARYPKDVSEFVAVDLSEEYQSDFFAPFVEESPIKIAAEFKQRIDLPINGTVMIVAAIKMVLLPEYCLSSDGFIDIHQLGTIACSGLDAYYSTHKIARLSYAKSEKFPELIPSFLIGK
ncbi:MAG: flavin reductase family protein [Bacteroidota bacterium]|jgi:flavin reductase (DIM6/NTAB) family NADH-FMN oxidoreductase RutF